MLEVTDCRYPPRESMFERHNAVGLELAPEQQPDGSCCACSPEPDGWPSWRLCYVAASHEHLKCLEKAKRASGRDFYAFLIAARRGSLQCLQLLCQSEIWPMYLQEPSICNCAIWGGHMECLQYLLDVGFQMHKRHCASAAAAGKLGCLQYLRDRNCPWDNLTCVRAAHAGEFECLVYSVEQGCPWWPWQLDVFDAKCLAFIERNAPRAVEVTLSRRSMFKLKALIAKRALTLHILTSRNVPTNVFPIILGKACLWCDIKITSNMSVQ